MSALSLLRRGRLAALLVLLAPLAAHAQSNAFRGGRVHVGVGYGAFTYYGPVDLRRPENQPGASISGDNYIATTDPAAVAFLSFPIVHGFYFRTLVGLTNLQTREERAIVQAPEENEFLRLTDLFFEPELVYTPFEKSHSRILPYVYTGFGGLLALKGRDQPNNPGAGGPGPDRSVFSVPFGAGLDLALTRRLSLFGEASYRFHLNYVFNNDAGTPGTNPSVGRNPFNSSLLMGGLRLGLERTRKVRILPGAPPPLPPALEIPPYQPPIARPVPRPKVCALIELNTIFFNIGSVNIAGEAQGLLDSNAQALRIDGACCLEIIGYADPQHREEALQMSQARARAVYDYYVRAGIDPSKLTIRAGGPGGEQCGKKDDCDRNRRVETRPVPCAPVRGQ